MSLTAQTLAVALLIAIPLIYSDRLPDVPRFISLALPSPPPPMPQESPRAAQSSTVRPSAAPLKMFTAPRRIVPLSEIPEVTAAEAPPAFANNSEPGVPGGTGAPSTLAQIIRTPITVEPKAQIVEAPRSPAKPVPIGGDVQAAKLIRQVVPVYPPLARQARVSGTVRLIGVIARDGTIQQLQVVSGHPLLIGAAMDAVRQWIYRPTLLNGQAVEVIAPIDVIFNLGR